MAIIYQNNFDSNTVGQLPSGWTNINGTWQVTAAAPVSGANTLKSTTSASDDIVLYTATGIADAIVSISNVYCGNTATPGILFRMNAAGSNGYFIGFSPSGKTISLYKKVSGTYTAIGTTTTITAPTYAVGDVWIQEVLFSGSLIEFRVWNVTQGQTRPSAASRSVTDTTYTAAGYNGVRQGATNTTQNGFDDFTINDATSTPPVNGLAIDRNNAAIVYSPYNWADDGTSHNTNNTGAYANFNFTGTSFQANIVALSGLSYYPVVRAYIDDAPAIEIQVTSGQTQLVFANGSLASGTHRVRFVVTKLDEEAGWWGLTNAIKVTGFVVDSGASVSAYTKRAKNMIFYGDSITMGVRTFGAAPAYPTGMDGTASVVPFIAESLGAEFGQIGYGAQGFAKAGNGDVPAFNTAYSSYSSGVSRLTGGVLSPAPDYVMCMHGTNGTPAQSDVATAISNLRTIAPSAIIFMIVPPGGFFRANITAAVNAAITAGDLNLKLIDAGSGTYQSGLNGQNGVEVIQAANEVSADTIHPLLKTNARLAAEYTRQMQHYLEPHRFTVVMT